MDIQALTNLESEEFFSVLTLLHNSLGGGGFHVHINFVPYRKGKGCFVYKKKSPFLEVGGCIVNLRDKYQSKDKT